MLISDSFYLGAMMLISLASKLIKESKLEEYVSVFNYSIIIVLHRQLASWLMEECIIFFINLEGRKDNDKRKDCVWCFCIFHWILNQIKHMCFLENLECHLVKALAVLESLQILTRQYPSEKRNETLYCYSLETCSVNFRFVKCCQV